MVTKDIGKSTATRIVWKCECGGLLKTPKQIEVCKAFRCPGCNYKHYFMPEVFVPAGGKSLIPVYSHSTKAS